VLRATGVVVEADAVGGGLGPLAGVLTALRRAGAASPPFAFVVTAPVDVPFLPPDLVARLQRERGAAAICVAASGGRAHPTVALWSVALADELERALRDERLRRVREFQARHRTAVAAWGAVPADPFTNVNTPDDLARARARLEDG
jgi:molybdopterin-guanine dinucleotide biosynthesis protein A